MEMSKNPLIADLDLILAETGSIWNELRDKRIFITGGTGFFGCWLLESFIWANEKHSLNARAVVLTRNPDAFRVKRPNLTNNANIILHCGDVTSFKYPTGEFSYVIDAAASAGKVRDWNSARMNFESMFDGTRRVLNFAEQAGTRRYLFVSSGAVYGRQPVSMTQVAEEYLGAPVTTDWSSFYGEGKRAGEHLSSLFTNVNTLSTSIARCFSFLGPYMPLNESFAVGNFIRDVLEDKDIILRGDGSPIRSYLYAADLMIWLWSILFKGVSGRAYNVGSAEEISILTLARKIATFGKPPCRVVINANSFTNEIRQRYVPNVDRMQKELGCKCYTDLQSAITKTLEWFHGAHGAGKVPALIEPI
jgi:nucleoside-diphosphate-sugar epimerase